MEYAQARMQARHGARPDEALWQRLSAQSSLAGYLGAARATALAAHLIGIGDRADLHAIERALRLRWRETVTELAGWLPREWQAAVRWCAVLIDLPALAWLSAGGAPQRWMQQDPVLAAHLAASAALGPVGRAAWHEAWRQRWPDGAREDVDALARLAAAVERHLAAFVQLPPGAAFDARRALVHEAERGFRRLAFRPVVAFAYLLLVALDLERLRADLVVRALGPEAAR